jgi:hypothetical protein
MLGTIRRIAAGLSIVAAGLALAPAPPVDAAGAYLPTGWCKPNAAVGAYADAGLDMAQSYVAIDGVRQTSYYGGNLLYTNAKNMAEGPHDASAHMVYPSSVKDVAWHFSVDATAPAFGEQSPKGSIDDRTPELVVPVTDAGSGLNPASTVMHIGRLGDPDVLPYAELPARYDAATGALRYQVPDIPDSLEVGHGPLLDGDYLVSVTALDKLGNRGALTWIITVDPLGLRQPAQPSEAA